MELALADGEDVPFAVGDPPLVAATLLLSSEYAVAEGMVDSI